MKQRYIKVNHKLIPVSEEVYLVHSRQIANERSHARRDGKCAQKDYRLCSGDCAQCKWYQEGYRMLSMQKAFGEENERETPELSNTAQNVDEIVADRLLLHDLYDKLDELMPDGARVFKMRAQRYSEREIAKTLGIASQSTLNYRIKKMDAYLRAHRDELDDLLR